MQLANDNTELWKVYEYFRNLADHFKENKPIHELVMGRWNFLHTESMGWAYLLAPSTQGGNGMVDND